MTYACSRCSDRGIYGGKLDGSYAGPWKWCDCDAAKRRDGEPNLVDEANAARERLLALVTPKGRETQKKSPEAEYSGDF